MPSPRAARGPAHARPAAHARHAAQPTHGALPSPRAARSTGSSPGGRSRARPVPFPSYLLQHGPQRTGGWLAWGAKRGSPLTSAQEKRCLPLRHGPLLLLAHAPLGQRALLGTGSWLALAAKWGAPGISQEIRCLPQKNCAVAARLGALRQPG